MVMECIVTVVLEVAKCLAPPTQQQLRYLRSFNANFENLKAEIENLKDKSRSIQRRVSEAERKGEKIEEEVEKWLVNANKIIEHADKFIDDEEATNKRCLKGLCPNLKTRHQLSKKAEAEVKAIVKIREEAGRFDDRISYRTIPEEIWLKSHKGFEAFESRLSTLKAIQNALIDVNVSVVGVYGMGGIGKTTLVKKVARQAVEDKLFDMVVFSEVSQTPDIKKIQQEIAEKLGLELHEEVESRRASRLFERLRNHKKILVVLDNIWKHLDLETVGIPFGEDHKGCKLLLTPRDRSVLLKMGSKDNFLINNLNEEEAWRLFKMMAGDDVENRELKSTAIDVARACGGLPIALTTVAKALRGKSLHEWKNSLRELQTPSMVNFEGVSAETYSSIELSFNHLKGEQLKKIFQLCSLMGNRILTLDLFKYSMGLGIFKGVNKMEDARDKLYALVHELRDSCLLLEGDSNERFSMHDVVCDVAISIACRHQHVFSVRNDEDVWDWPDEDALRKCNAISLINNSNREFPEGLECPNLELLYISLKDSSLEINIPENFFVGMKKLRVLDFTGMQLSSFPSSIGLLVNLHTLCLDQSALGDIAIIGKLKNLEVLSFLKSDIMQLPEELRQLNKLRLLDLTNCFHLKVIAPNLISSLTRLEELYMGNYFIEWEVERANSKRSNASLDELMHLPRLTTLEIDVKNDRILPEGWPESSKGSKYLLEMSHSCLPRVLDKIGLKGINNVEYLWLDKLQGTENVLFNLDTEGFSQLKLLWVQNNPDFFCIVDSREMVACDAFPLLESLILHNLINMERICVDRLKVESFNELKTVEAYNCDKLSNIFWLSTSKCLPRLERIAVVNCSKMKEIFAIGEEVDNAIEKIEFAQLRYLSLGNLPEVTSFCRREVETPSASPNRQASQEESTTMYSSSEITLDISTLLFNEKNNENDQLGIPAQQTLLPLEKNLTELVAFGCKELIHLVTSSTAKTLVRLVKVQVYGCRAMTEVVINNKDGVEKEEIVFRKLKTLELSDLDSLTSFCSANYTFKFPSLQALWVIGCPKLKIFTTGESSTPPRVNVWYRETAGFQRRWANNDLNTTIQQLHAEKGSPLVNNLNIQHDFPKTLQFSFITYLKTLQFWTLANKLD
ncbi:Disease resistance protein [Citrus sinensis]|nr:Disease resistance protein [Citrus sinensis]